MTTDGASGERIDLLRSAIDAGTYRVEPEAVADAIVRVWSMEDVVDDFLEGQSAAPDAASSDSANR